jgi:uncharacterized cupin superfamily protein
LRDEVVSSDPSGQIEVIVAHVAPGGGTDGAYTHGADIEMVLVVKGSILLTLGDNRVTLSEGDALTFSGNVPHGYTNTSAETAELVWVMTPAAF